MKAMQQNTDLVTESYRAGKIDFLQLVVIRRQAIDTQREYIDVLEELNAAEAELGRAVGRAQ
jgi:cobalt-zinc-cadmium efflux system outer membrane protein